MLRHEELRNDPLGVARRVWDDTAWRAAIITAALIFLLELVIWAVAVEPGVGWVASIVTLLAIGRALTMRPLRGELNDPENLSLLLGLVALLSAESLFWFTSIGDTFAEHAIYWPFSLVLMGQRAGRTRARTLCQATAGRLGVALRDPLLHHRDGRLGGERVRARPVVLLGRDRDGARVDRPLGRRPRFQRAHREPAQRSARAVHRPDVVARIRRRSQRRRRRFVGWTGALLALDRLHHGHRRRLCHRSATDRQVPHPKP